MQSILHFICFSVLFLTVQSQCDPALNYTICGQGSGLGRLIINFGYSGFSSVNFFTTSASQKNFYLPSNSLSGRQAIIDQTIGVQFGVSDTTPYSDAQRIANASLKLRNWPLAVGAFIVLVHVPGLFPLNVTVFFPRDVMADIYLRNITHWNDPRILAVQDPQVYNILVNYTTPIHLVLRTDQASTTSALSEYLCSASPTFKAAMSGWNNGVCPFGVWPTPAYFPLYNHPDIQFQNQETTYSNVEVTEGGFTVVSIVAVKDRLKGVIASIENRRGQIITIRDGNDLTPIYQDFQVDENFIVNTTFVDADIDKAYPIAVPVYACFSAADLPGQDCDERRLTLLFFRWLLTDQSALETTINQGYAPVPPDVANLIVVDIDSITCNGRLATAVDLETVKPASQIAPLLTLSALVFVAAVILCGVYCWKEYKGMIVIMHAIVLTFVTMVTCAAVIPWCITPSNDSVCLARIWLTFISITAVAAITFSKAFIATFIYSLDNTEFMELQEERTKTMKKAVQFNILPLVLVLPQIVILIVWTCVKRYESIIFLSDEVLRIGEYQCDSDTYAYSIVEGIYFLILGIAGLGIVYYSWRVNLKTSHSRFALISLYNLILSGIVFIPLFIFLDGEAQRSSIVSAILIFLAFQTVVTFYLPAFTDLGYFDIDQ